jgi:hypothetical protein
MTAHRLSVGQIILGIIVVLLTNVVLAACIFLLFKAPFVWTYLAGFAVAVVFGSLFVRPAVAIHNLLRPDASLAEPGYAASFLCVFVGAFYSHPITNAIPHIWPPSASSSPLYLIAISAVGISVYVIAISVALGEAIKQPFHATWSAGLIQAVIQFVIGAGCLYVMLLLS